MLEEIPLHRSGGPRPNPECEKVVREVDDRPEHAGCDVERAQEQYTGKRRRHSLDAYRVEEGRAEVIEAETTESAHRRRLDAAAERQVEDRRHEHRQQAGEQRRRVRAGDQQCDHRPVRPQIASEQPTERA